MAAPYNGTATGTTPGLEATSNITGTPALRASHSAGGNAAELTGDGVTLYAATTATSWPAAYVVGSATPTGNWVETGFRPPAFYAYGKCGAIYAKTDTDMFPAVKAKGVGYAQGFVAEMQFGNGLVVTQSGLPAANRALAVLVNGKAVIDNIEASTLLVSGAKSFQIDHPLDPRNAWLRHSCVESPEMKNVYDGIATADAAGDAAVDLPPYFEALNVDYRYQLTAIGSATRPFIKREIAKGRFVIGGADPGQKISWQVTGVRNDATARSRPLVVEEQKDEADRGYYVDPEAFGESRDMLVPKYRPTTEQRPSAPEAESP